jgi:cell division protein FtsA
LNSHGIVAIRDKEVSAGDVERVIDAARAVAIPADQRVIHVLPQEFIVDSQEGIREPIGMSGVRLEGKVHLVTGAVSAAQNVVKCVQRCGLTVEDMVLEQLASSYAVLTEDEKELGVCLVDMGGGTTDIAIFCGGAIQHTAVIPIAGDQVTNDIAVSLRTPLPYAEEIKIKYACALSQLANPDETIEVPSVGDRPPRRLARQTLAEVVEPRYEELYQLVREEPPASCSRAAARRWKARSSSPRKSFTCRYGSAFRSSSTVSRTSCAIRSTRPASGCCCTASKQCRRRRKPPNRATAFRARSTG